MGTARITFILALGASLWGAAAVDTADAPRPEAEASATVTVTAEALPVPLDQTPNPVLVIDQARIEQSGAANVAQLLQGQLPGQVYNSGGVGTSTSICLGGTRAQDTVVTLDGLRLDDATGLGGVNAALISLAGLDRIEVQQGPCSTRFGSDAMGGAVALYSAASAPAGASGEVRAAVGTEGIARGYLAGAYGWDRGWVRVAATAQKEDQVLDPDNHYRSTGLFLGGGRQVSDDTLVTFNYFNTYSGVPIPILYVSYGPGNRAFNGGVQDQDRTQIVNGTLRTQFSPDVTGELTLGQVLQNRMEPDANTVLALDPYTSRRNQVTGHLSWQPSTTASLTLGLDGSEEYGSSPNLLDTEQLSATATHMAVYLEGERELVANLRLVASLRTEHDHQAVPPAQGGTGVDDTTETTGKLGVNWLLPEGFRAFANVGTGFSNPLLYDAIFNAQYGGEQLDNERSRTVQAGLNYASGPWKAGLLLSRILYANMVYYTYAGGVYLPAWGTDSGIYLNGNQIRVQSAELKGGYATSRWGITAFYRNQEARSLLAPAAQQLSSTASAIHSPFQTLGANAFRVLGAFRLEGNWSWTGPHYDAALPEGMSFNGHYNDLSLAVIWSARPDLTFTLRGDNLMQPNTSVAQWLAGTRDFQNDASQSYGYPAQPATVDLEVRYRF